MAERAHGPLSTHRGYALQAGRLVLQGPAADLLQDEAVRLAYLRRVG